MALTNKQKIILGLTAKVRDELFNGEFDDDTTYLDVVKLFPRVEPEFKPEDLGHTTYEALANALAELVEALPDDDDDEGDFFDNAIKEIKKNPIKTAGAILTILTGGFGFFG